MGALAAAAALYPLLCEAATVSFVPLGPSILEVSDISADGSTFVGTLGTSPWEAFVGRLGEDPLRLGTELGVRGTGGGAISGDGKVIAGGIFDAYPDRSVFIWSTTSPMRRIDGGSGVLLDTVSGISFNGDVLVGRMRVLDGNKWLAYRWTEATGAVPLGELPGGNVDSFAVDVSADGRVVVGNSGVDDGEAPFRWTAEDGMVRLPTQHGQALAVSPDGATIVGSSRRNLTVGQRAEAAVWKAGEEVRLLGVLPAGRSSTATDASLSGEVVVGVSVGVDLYGVAFRWTELSGMKSLATLLTTGGVDLTGWRLHSIRAVSNDGTVFVGRATNPSGRSEEFIATLPVNFVPEPNSALLIVIAGYGTACCRRKFAAAERGQ